MKKCVVTIALVVLANCVAAAAEEVPKVGAYVGYQYVRFTSATNAPAFSANGGDGQFIYNLNSWFGGVADLGAVHKGSFAGYNLDTTFANFLFGPRVSARKSRFVPYLQVLVGGVYATSSTPIAGIAGQPLTAFTPIIPGQPITARLSASQTAFAMTAGGGLDIKLSKHATFRPIEVDYYFTRLQNLRTLSDNNQNNLRYTGGFAFWFGGPKAAVVPPPPPPPPHVATKTCPNGTTVSANQACPKTDLSLGLSMTATDLCPGDKTQIMASAGNGAHNQLSYVWSVNGQPVGQEPSLAFDSAGKDPGVYHIAVHVGGNEFNPASAETTITVREYRPPTGTLQANPAVIHAGDTSALSANFTGQCGGPIQPPTYTAPEGTIQGDRFNSAGVQFDLTNHAEQRKTVTITAMAADNRSTGTAAATVEVIKEAVVAAPIRLPDVLFSANSSRVNNCGKRILLEQLRSYFERDSGGTVVLVGHSSSDEAAGLAEKRAQNAAAVITAGAGVCLSIPQAQVQVSWPGVEQNGVNFEAGFCQSSVGAASVASQMRRVEVWFVPSGGRMPASLTNNQSASTLSLSGLGCPK